MELLQLHGIGRWSAEYIMLRGLGRLGVFPADDIAGQKNLYRWLSCGRSRVTKMCVDYSPDGVHIKVWPISISCLPTWRRPVN
jgi:DNA-3-methyladenine glycosylase II